MFSFFKKQARVTVEEQLAALAECGIVLNPEARVEDLFGFHTREEHEAKPYEELIPALGTEMERKPYAPVCERLWMCDYERIEDHGAYADVIDRLCRMSERVLPISNITDYVVVDEGKAWVEFDLDGARIHWDAEVNNDWLDPSIVVKFDKLLKDQETGYRIYSNHTHFGQCAYFACLRAGEFERFQKLATFKMKEIAKQA